MTNLSQYKEQNNYYKEKIKAMCEKLIIDLITTPNLQYKYTSNSISNIHHGLEKQENISLLDIIEYMTFFIDNWKEKYISYVDCEKYQNAYHQNKIKELRNLLPILKSLSYPDYEKIIEPLIHFIQYE